MADPDLKAKYKIKLRASWQPDLLRNHKLHLITDSLLTMKKKMLRAFKLSKENPANFLFSLNFFHNTFFLTNEEDFYFFLSLHIQCLEEDPLIIEISPQKLTKKALLAKESLKNSDHPSDPIYEAESEVFCVFCKESSNNLDMIQDLGLLYGPFKIEGKEFYCHERCAIWTPDVYLDMDNNMKNISKEIKRARKFTCSYCGNYGAGLGCWVKNCKRTYHFKCSLQEDLDCVLDYKNYTLYCSEHKDEAPLYPENELIYETIFCRKCGSGSDDEKLIICEGCLEACHIYCMQEKMEEVPEEDWFCGDCQRKNQEKTGIEEEIIKKTVFY